MTWDPPARRTRLSHWLRLEDRLTPATVSWDGGGGNLLWSEPLNWSGDALPGATDDVVIGTAFDQKTISLTVTAKVASLTSEATVSVAATGTLDVSGADPDVPVQAKSLVIAGTLRDTITDADSPLFVSDGGVLDGVTVDGLLRVGFGTNGATEVAVVGSGGLTLNGTADLGNSSFQGGQLSFTGTQTLRGAGSVVFRGDFDNGIYGSGGTLTVGDKITVNGQNGFVGDSTGTTINTGTIRADVAGGFITLAGSHPLSPGLLDAANGGTVLLAGTIAGTGTVNIGANASLRVGGTGRLTGVTVARPLFVSDGGVLDGVTVDGLLRVGFGTNGATEVAVVGSGGLTLNGTADLGNSSFQGGQLSFTGTQTLRGAGSVVFRGDFDNGIYGSGGTLTVGDKITVNGQNGFVGDSTGTTINTGTIRADVAGGFITLAGSHPLSPGLLDAANGGTVLLAGTIAGTGTVNIGANASLRVGGTGRLTGVTVARPLFVSDGGVLDGVTVDGLLRVGFGTNGATEVAVVGSGGLTLNGTADLGNSSFQGGQLSFTGTQTLRGAGSVVFRGDFDNGIYGSGGTLTVGDKITVNGQNGFVGSTGATTIHQGLLHADAGGTISTFGTFTNQGELRATNGTIDARNLTNLDSNGILTGGVYTVNADGRLRFARDITALAATFTLADPSATVVVGSTTTGALVPLTGITAAGELALRGGTDLTLPSLTNAGRLSLGSGSVLTLAGDFNNTAGGRLITQVTGGSAAGAFGKLAVGGAAKLAGAFEAQALGAGFQLNDSYTVLQATGVRTGQFATEAVAGNTVNYTDTGVVLGIVPPNTAPTVSAVGNQSGAAGAAVGPIGFTVGDAETPAGNLAVTATSDNPTLLPPAGLVLSGTGPNRTITVTSAGGQTGTATVTLTVTDGGGLIATETFTLTVTAPPPNTAPTVGPIANQTATAGTPLGPIAFAVGDAETAPAALTVTGLSNNTVLVPTANIVFGGSGASRTVTVTPVAGQSGTAIITVTVADAGGLTATETFTVTVTPVIPPPNTAPTVGDIANQAVAAGGTAGPVAFAVGDAETAPATLSVTGASSNTALVPAANIVFGGSGASRTVTVTPAVGQSGTATITITVTDAGGLTASDTFTVTVAPVVPTTPATELVGVPPFGVGGAGAVTLYNPDGTPRFAADPFPGFAGELRTAAADFNGDGVADLVVGTGPGRATRVVVLDGVTAAELFAVDPFEAAFTGGVYVAAGDLNGDGVADLVITPDEGGGPRVDVYSGAGFGKFASFFGIDDPNFRGGARAATGDISGDGTADLVVVAGFGGGPRVAAFDGKSVGGEPARLFGDFFAFEQALRNGIFVAVGDVDGDGFADLIAGGGPGGGPRVTVFSGQSLLRNEYEVRGNFFGGDETSRGGIRVAAKDLDGDDRADIVVGAGAGAGSRVTAYLGRDLAPAGTPPAVLDFDAFAGATGGVFVG